MKKTTKLPTFDLIEKYNEESTQSLELQEKLAQQVTQAQTLVNALDYRYSEGVRAAVLEGKDNAEELDEISEQLDKAKRDLDRAKRMQQVGVHAEKRTVSQQEVEQGLRDFQKRYQSEVMDEQEKEVYKAKEAYIATLLEYIRRQNHFEAEARSAFFTIYPSYSGYSIPYSVGLKTQDNIKHTCITSEDLRALEQGKKPTSLQPIMKMVEDGNGHLHYVPVDDEEGENN